MEIIEYLMQVDLFVEQNQSDHKSGSVFFFPLFLVPPTAGLLSRESKARHK